MTDKTAVEAMAHPVDAIKHYMGCVGLRMDPEIEAEWRAFCDEPPQ